MSKKNNDMLERFIFDYKEGRITLEDLERRLSFDQFVADKRNKRDVSISDYVQYSSDEDDPLNLMIKRELFDKVASLFPLIKKRLNENDWFILSGVIDGKQLKDIAKELNWKASRVRKRYQRIRYKIKQVFQERGKDIEGYIN